MIRSCTFESNIDSDADCEALFEGKSRFFHPDFGNCFAFNFRGANGTGRKTALSGTFFGLRVIAGLETNYNMKVIKGQFAYGL